MRRKAIIVFAITFMVTVMVAAFSYLYISLILRQSINSTYDSVYNLAGQLAYFQTVAKDWRYVLKAREMTAAVTPQDIQRVARAYFTKTNRTVATLVRATKTQ